MASPSGDGGRDAELFSLSTTVWCQYSVQDDWKSKLRGVLKNLSTKNGKITVLIYATSRRIGALGDDFKAIFATEGIHLDIRDCSWFVERMYSCPSNEAAAEEVSAAIVDPLLEQRGITTRLRGSLDRQETDAALVYLEMQSQDQQKSKRFNKIVFQVTCKGRSSWL